MDIITLSTIVISICAISVSIVTAIWSVKKVTKKYHFENDVIDVSAIVSEFSQRMKRLEEGLVDQKVKHEILELRIQKHHVNEIHPSLVTNNPEEPTTSSDHHLPTRKSQIVPWSDDYKLGMTERNVLHIVLEGAGRLNAKEIQQRIGKTREHTARLMNSLFREGFVKRDTNVRPYAYTITDKGRNALKV